MGSVPDVYTTGDNDPEIEPVSYYRHYLYCDACGSFQLESWITPDDHEAIEQRRRRLGKAVLIVALGVVVLAWAAVGFLPSLAFLLLVAAGASIVPLFRGYRRLLGLSVAQSFGFLGIALLVAPLLLVMEWFASDFLPVPVILCAGLLLITGLLVVRGVWGSKIEILGMRCGACGATYAHGTPFFTDLDANPRHLTVEEVPRPLGSSTFLQGKFVERESPKPYTRLPP